MVVPATGLAVLLAVGYLLAPRMGTDLSAQVAHADFFRGFGLTPVDLRWYGGSQQFGYSLLSPAVMALLTVRGTGALALVGATAAFALLLARSRVSRPLVGALVAAPCIAGNLVSGRVTWALGAAFGVTALALLTFPGHRWAWRGAALAAVLASATSPVAGLFVGLAGVALLVTERSSARVRDGMLLALAAGVPLLVTSVLFGDGGWMNTGRTDTVHAIVTSLLVAALVPHRAIRVGALLSAAGVLVAALVHTPVGLNATRLVVMFALPTLAAAARLPEVLTARLPARAATRPVPVLALVALLAFVAWWQPPVLRADLRDRGNPSSERSYFAPLLAQLDALPLTGRVEIPPTRDYWEAAYLGRYPLARGWLRQVDIERNPLFFTDIPGDGGTGVPLTAQSYRDWLDRTAVQFVAVPDVPLSWVGRPEAALVDAGLPYLTLLWTGAHWRLYTVDDPTPIVAAPAALTGTDAAHLTFTAPAAGDVTVRVRWSRWLTVTGGGVLYRDGDSVRVSVPGPGSYTLSSSP